MGLNHPSDLDAWRRWQERRRLARSAARAVLRRGRPDAVAPAFLATRGDDPVRVLVVLESRAASSRMAVLEPLRHLNGVGLGVLSSFDASEYLPGEGWATASVDPGRLSDALPDLGVVVSAAHYLPLGASAFADAQARGHTYVTVQHGLLTPFAPPLPPGAPFLAWSDADARFWLSGREDAEASVVGSQLLWASAQTPGAHVSRFARPVFLGQLHAAEIGRATLSAAVTRFSRETGACYRPHPSETDRLSRWQHCAWERLGIEIDRSPVPLSQLAAPVVSAFSTGLLEAAARGVPAWGYCPGAPAWVEEFWDRYGIARWGSPPTDAPALPATEPARAVADWVRSRL